MDKFLYPTRSFRWIITAPSESGKSVFPTYLILNSIDDFRKKYIYSTSLHLNLYEKLIKCFSNYTPMKIIPNIFNDEDLDVINEEIVNDEDFENPYKQIETYESIEEMKYPQEYDGGMILLNDLIEKEMNDPRIQAMFNRSGHKNLSIFLIIQVY